MRGHAKASSAGSTEGNGNNRGRLVAVLAAAVLASVLLGASLADALAPTVTIEPAANVAYTSADVEGEVNPEGQPTTYRFEYIADAAFQAHADAQQSLYVSANAGTFTLSFQGQTTPALPFNATASEVEAALNALSTIGGAGGSVAVSGGPGDEAGLSPYAISFGGNLAETNVGPGVEVDSSALSGGTGFTYSEVTTQGRAPGFDGAASSPEESTETAGPVTAGLTGLAPNTTYHLRLRAENADGPAAAIAPNFTTEAVSAPVVVTDDATAVTATTAKAAGEVTAGGADPAFNSPCRFEYVTQAQFDAEAFAGAAQAPCDVEPTGPAPTDVKADLTGLQPNTTYHLRLVAENAGGPTAVPAANVFKTLAVGPVAWAGTNTPESASTVLLRGAVNPKNSALSDCHFTYGPTTAYGQSAPCEGAPGAAGEPVPVTAKLSGLAPGSVGHFKVIATNGAGTGESLDAPFATFEAPAPNACPNQAHREEQHSSFLAECRAWEMVSPPAKNGGDVIVSSSRTRAALDGEAAQFSSLQGFGDSKAAAIATPYIANRDRAPGTQGWSTHGILPQLEPNHSLQALFGLDTVYQAEFSPDLDKGVLATHTPLTDEPQTDQVQNLYLREGLLTPGADSSQLLSPCLVCAQTGEPLRWRAPNAYRPKVADATPDLGQILFEANRNLTADAPAYPPFPSSFCNADPKNPAPYLSGCAPRLYESDHGALRLVGRIPPAGEIECDDAGATPCEGAPVSIAGISALAFQYTPNTISDDGSKAFFTVPSSGYEDRGDLYLRLDHTATVQLNASERTDCADHDPCSGAPEPDPGGHQPARYAIASADGSKVFFTSSEQLTDTTTEGDLYVYDTTLPASDPHNLRHVYEGRNESVGVLGTSEDGSYLYFAYQGALLPGQPEPSAEAALAIYVWHNGAISLIGSVHNASLLLVGTGVGFDNRDRDSRVTPDGRTLLFAGDVGAGLTGYDHGNKCGGGLPCTQLYRYRADTGSLTCVSCNPRGATAAATINVSISSGGAQPSSHSSRPLTDDGSHAFFETAERLLDADTDAASDVYSYDARTGALGLVSSGTDSEGAHFLDASPDGSNVFFSTRQPLLGWDSDDNIDLYDARVGGGFPEPAPVPAPCHSDSCRTPSAPPATSSPASQSFSGPANAKAHRKHKRKHRKHAGKKHRQKRAGHKQGGSK